MKCIFPSSAEGRGSGEGSTEGDATRWVAGPALPVMSSVSPGRSGVTLDLSIKWASSGLALWRPVLPHGAPTQKGPTLGVMFGCRHLEILSKHWATGPHVFILYQVHKLHSLPWAWYKICRRLCWSEGMRSVKSNLHCVHQCAGGPREEGAGLQKAESVGSRGMWPSVPW